MAKKYFIWKNPVCNGENSEWIEISGSQFFELMNNKNQKRYFKKIDDGEEDGADILIFETTYEEYKEWHKTQEKIRRNKKNQEQYKLQFISVNDLILDTEFTYADIIIDTNVNVEDEVLTDIELSELQVVIKNLNDDEKSVLDMVKRSKEDNISERKICEIYGIDQSTFWSRKKKIFKKIKNFFGQN